MLTGSDDGRLFVTGGDAHRSPKQDNRSVDLTVRSRRSRNTEPSHFEFLQRFPFGTSGVLFTRLLSHDQKNSNEMKR
ncbi:hypothetical protein F2P81_021591 [Scophthalmus maximus]|uniref:Uncharacterized protein n=1 Tax=Scophthalmus maximus TaxID=52904 RepID=A0A6A4S8A8_SCOMX|nr:hypothetical protein F2P81_021591 [Scophthalmus maximus]